jgi:hypothetical protein
MQKSELEQDVMSALDSAEAQANSLRKHAEERKGKISAWWEELQHDWNKQMKSIRKAFEKDKPNTTRRRRSAPPNRPTRTPRSRSSTHPPRSRKRSTPYSTPSSRTRKPTSSRTHPQPPDAVVHDGPPGARAARLVATETRTMIEVILFAVFFGGITIGALIANKLGKLPSADELEAQDQARWVKFDPVPGD